MAVQGMVLRENGYACDEGSGLLPQDGQRVRVPFDAAVIAEAEGLIARAWETARAERIPEPLVDSPKCPGCSLVGICLPDETAFVHESELSAEPEQLGLFESPRRKPVKREVRALVTPRSELRPLYLNTQGLRVGKSGAVLQVKDKEKVVQEVRLGEINQVSLMGNVQISTQAVQSLCESGVPVCYFSMGGWFYGITTGMNQKNVFLRRSQFRLSDAELFAARWRGSWWRGRFAIRERCCSGITWSRGASTLAGHEGDGGAGGAAGSSGGAAGDGGKRGAAVFRRFRGDDQAGRRGGRSAEFGVRFRGAEPAAAAGSGERVAVAGVQSAGEGSDGGELRGGVRSVYRVLSPAAVWASGAGVGFDGAVSAADCGFGGVDGGEYGDGDGAGFRARGRVGGAERGAGGRDFSGRTNCGWIRW